MPTIPTNIYRGEDGKLTPQPGGTLVYVRGAVVSQQEFDAIEFAKPAEPVAQSENGEGTTTPIRTRHRIESRAQRLEREEREAEERAKASQSEATPEAADAATLSTPQKKRSRGEDKERK